MISDLDPVAIRKALVTHRAKGTPWPEAWLDVTGHHGKEDDTPMHEHHVVTFMHKHFRAAYFNTDAPEGRCRIDERDVSAAVGSGSTVTVPVVHEHCRSGDGCDRPATRGRFGKYWCEHHGAELERLAGGLRLDLAKADPRKGGNTSLYTHKAA